ncbi:MAG TPA: hypothetical protein VED46_06280 [Alphaproteobacteria bacterium]|nr:hypothetical protein [Alphaproteobacteria bacterium]
MKLVVKAVGIVCLGLLLQASHCTAYTIFGEQDPYEAKLEEYERLQNERREKERLAERQAWKDYYYEVVHPTGRFESYEDYEDELDVDPAFDEQETKKQAEWKRERNKKKVRAPGEGGGGGGGGGGGH